MNTETEEFPCIRGCAWDNLIEGEEPRPKPQKHGNFCNSCYWRVRHALELVPDLVANMRLQIGGLGAAPLNERVQGGGDGSPAPLRIAPLDASDSLYAKLVSWTEQIGGELQVPQPSVAVWINFREVQGFKPVTPETAHDIASQLVAWFIVRLDDIFTRPLAEAFHDDICYGWEEARGIFSLLHAYGVEKPAMREAEKRECPICGTKEVFVKWPDSLDPDIAVMCGRCKWVAEPQDEAVYAKVFSLD